VRACVRARGAAAAAALLAAFHPAHVAWSQEVRGYAGVLAFAPLVLALVISERRDQRTFALAFAVALAAWAHLTSGLLVLGLGAYALGSRSRGAGVGLAWGLAGAIALYAPILSHVGPFAQKSVAIEPPTLEQARAIAELLLVGDARVHPAPVPLALALAALVVVGLVASWRERLGPAAASTFAVTALAWLVARPLFHARFFLFLLPLVLALAGRGAGALVRGRRAVLLVAPFVAAFAVADARRSRLETEPVDRALARVEGRRFTVVGLGADLVSGGQRLDEVTRAREPFALVALFPDRPEAREARARCEREGWRAERDETLEGLYSDVRVTWFVR
jgi:hypothetical protein